MTKEGAVTHMADGCRTSTAELHLLPFDETDHTIVFQLMAESVGHLSCEKRVMFETVEQIVTCMSFGDKPGNSDCDSTQFHCFRTSMRSSKEHQSGGGCTNGVILRIFLCIKKRLPFRELCQKKGTAECNGCDHTCLMTRPPKLCPINMIFGGKECCQMGKHDAVNIEGASRTSCGPRSMSSKFNNVFA